MKAPRTRVTLDATAESCTPLPPSCSGMSARQPRAGSYRELVWVLSEAERRQVVTTTRSEFKLELARDEKLNTRGRKWVELPPNLIKALEELAKREERCLESLIVNLISEALTQRLNTGDY